MAGVSN